MFNNIHHVTYIVKSIQQMAEYMETNFGLKPERTDELSDGGVQGYSIPGMNHTGRLLRAHAR